MIDPVLVIGILALSAILVASGLFSLYTSRQLNKLIARAERLLAELREADNELW